MANTTFSDIPQRIEDCDTNKRHLDILKEGIYEDGDSGQTPDSKPLWLDKEKLLRVSEIFEDNCSAVLLGHFLGQALMSQVPSLAQLLVYTGNHSTRPLATKRAALTVGYVMGWYKGRIWNVDDPAYKSIQNIRNIHKAAKEKVSKTHPKSDHEGPWMSQYDMALTQFAFIGPLLLYPEYIGLHCEREDMECLVHFWRYIAYLLGTKDKYNLCDVPYDELLETCRDIVKDVSVPTFTNPVESFTAIGITGTEGYAFMNRLLDYNAFHNFTSYILGLKGKGRALTLRGYFCSLFLWYVPKLFQFSFLRKLMMPSYGRTLEYRIGLVLKEIKDGEAIKNSSDIALS